MQTLLLTVKQALQLLVEELLLGPGGGEAGGAQPDRVDEAHAVELQLLPAALAAEDLPAAATVVLECCQVSVLEFEFAIEGSSPSNHSN